MEHTYLNYSEATLYSECVQYFMKRQDIASEQMVVDYIKTNAPACMNANQINKVINVAVIALFTDDTIEIETAKHALHN